MSLVEKSVEQDDVSGDILKILIGNREWLAQNEVAVPSIVDQLMIAQEQQGKTAVLVVVNST